MASALNSVAMETRLPQGRAVTLACEVGTNSELAGQGASLALLTIWHMHGAQRHAAAGRRTQAVARVRAVLIADDARRRVTGELARRVAP